jgi:hypothetical protein
LKFKKKNETKYKKIELLGASVGDGVGIGVTPIGVGTGVSSVRVGKIQHK